MANISERLRARSFARSLDQDKVLTEVRKFIVNNIKPTAQEMSQLPDHCKQIMKFFEHLSYRDGLIILTTPMRMQKDYSFVERVVVPIGMYRCLC